MCARDAKESGRYVCYVYVSGVSKVGVYESCEWVWVVGGEEDWMCASEEEEERRVAAASALCGLPL